MTCIRYALVGKKNCPACRNLSSLLLNSLCYIAENTTFFSVDIHLSAWLIKSRQIKSILGKLSKKYQILSAWLSNYQILSEIKKNHPALMTWTIHHQTKWAIQGPGDWSGTQTAAVPGWHSCPRESLVDIEGSPLVLQTWKSVQHWYTNIGGFLRTCTKKNMWDFVSVFSAELRFPLTIRGRPIFSDHLGGEINLFLLVGSPCWLLGKWKSPAPIGTIPGIPEVILSQKYFQKIVQARCFWF